VAVAAVAFVAVLLLRGTALVVAIGLLAAAALAGIVSLWQRQGISLRREVALGEQLKALSRQLDDHAKAQRAREAADDERRAAEAEQLEKERTKSRFERRHDFAQLEALVNLYVTYPPTARMPGLRGWAVSPDLLLVVVDLLRQRRPRVVVELGAGSSTVWLAHVVRQLGLDTTVITLEHDPVWAEKVGSLLHAQGLGDRSQVRLAPLEPQDLPAGQWPWYAPAAWQDLAGVDLLLVDGPPGDVTKDARYPAVPLLASRLSDDAVVVMDDAARPAERRIAERWQSELESFQRLDVPVEKKAIIFYRGDSPGL
jgi:predicted O-methyltransferase YrrM